MGQQKNTRNPFHFKHFTVFQDHVALPVTTDACLFGAWISQFALSENNKILDIGTGTGLLVFMLAQKFPKASITGIDIHPPSILAAQKSLIEGHTHKPTNITFELQNVLKMKGHSFHSIISNPPFFSRQLTSPNPIRNLARHSNDLTLKTMIEQCFTLLSTDGNLFLMYPFEEHPVLLQTLRDNNFSIQQTAPVASNENKKPHLLFIHATKCNIPQVSLDPPLENRINLYEISDSSTSIQHRNPYNLTPQSANLLKDYYIKL